MGIFLVAEYFMNGKVSNQNPAIEDISSSVDLNPLYDCYIEIFVPLFFADKESDYIEIYFLRERQL